MWDIECFPIAQLSLRWKIRTAQFENWSSPGKPREAGQKLLPDDIAAKDKDDTYNPL